MHSKNKNVGLYYHYPDCEQQIWHLRYVEQDQPKMGIYKAKYSQYNGNCKNDSGYLITNYSWYKMKTIISIAIQNFATHSYLILKYQ